MEMRIEDVALGGRRHVWAAKYHRSTDPKEQEWGVGVRVGWRL